MGVQMAGSVAQHNAANAAARGKNNAIAKKNYLQGKEYEVTANLDNVKYLNDVQTQDAKQDQLYQQMIDQHSDTDYQLKSIFADADMKIEDRRCNDCNA